MLKLLGLNYALGDGEGDGEVGLSPAAGPPLASVPVPELFFELLVLDFLLGDAEVLLAEPLVLVDFFVDVCVLLPDVVVAVSVVFVHEATNATPTTATREVRRDFFIGRCVA